MVAWVLGVLTDSGGVHRGLHPSSALQSQKAVTAYFTRKQLLPFSRVLPRTPLKTNLTIRSSFFMRPFNWRLELTGNSAFFNDINGCADVEIIVGFNQHNDIIEDTIFLRITAEDNYFVWLSFHLWERHKIVATLLLL